VPKSDTSGEKEEKRKLNGGGGKLNASILGDRISLEVFWRLRGGRGILKQKKKKRTNTGPMNGGRREGGRLKVVIESHLEERGKSADLDIP